MTDARDKQVDEQTAVMWMRVKDSRQEAAVLNVWGVTCESEH